MAEQKRPRLVVLIGYHAVGKSEYTKGLEAQRAIIISGDSVMRELMGRYNELPTHEMRDRHRKEKQAIIEQRICDALSLGEDVVVDQLNTTRLRREKAIRLAKQSSQNYLVEAVVFHPPEEQEHARRLVKRILFERNRTVNDALYYDRIAHEYEPPTKEEGFDLITEIGVPPKQPLMRM